MTIIAGLVFAVLGFVVGFVVGRREDAQQVAKWKSTRALGSGAHSFDRAARPESIRPSERGEP